MCSYAVMQAHLATVLRIAESSSSATGGAHLATLYDDFMRRHLMWRAHRHDQTLDILKEVQEPCKEVLQLAQQRLEGVLQSAGLDVSRGSSGSSVFRGDVSLAAQLGQQQAATADLYKKSQEATRAMVEQAAELRKAKLPFRPPPRLGAAAPPWRGSRARLGGRGQGR